MEKRHTQSHLSEVSSIAVPISDFEPARIFEIELEQPLPTLSATNEQTGQCYSRASCFVRLHSHPLGLVELPLDKGTLEPKEYALFFQVIAQGYQLVYTPAALGHHLHRRDYQSLQKQIYNQGVGGGASLLKCLLENPQLRLDFVTKVPYGLFLLLLSSWLPKNEKNQTHYPKEFAKELRRLRRKGMLYGPLAYLRSRRAMRKLQDVAASLETQADLPVPREHSAC